MPTSITSSGITFDDATTLTTGVLPTANIANGAVTPAKLSQPYALATSVASTSGTAIDFTGIPSWAKRVTVILNGVSTNGSSLLRIQLGSGTVQTSSYNGRNTTGTTGWNSTATSSGGFDLAIGGASQTVDGSVVFHNPSGNTWVASGILTASQPSIIWTGGNTSLSGSLDRVRITTVNGTDTFDAGTVNISYQG